MARDMANQGRIGAGGPTGHIHGVDDLVDVDTSGAIEGDALLFNGEGWFPGPPVPTGTIIALASSTAPPGYLLARGGNVSRTTYPELFDTIGTTYGGGDGSTTFGLPSLTGTLGGASVWWFIRT